MKSIQMYPPNSYPNTFLLLDSNIENQIAIVPEDTTPIPSPHDKLTLRPRVVSILFEQWELGVMAQK